jgi:hypothetical protein
VQRTLLASEGAHKGNRRDKRTMVRKKCMQVYDGQNQARDVRGRNRASLAETKSGLPPSALTHQAPVTPDSRP